MKRPAAIIFDLDGTLIDNNAYHILAWQEFYKGIGQELTLEHYRTKMNGKVNRDIFSDIFQRDLSNDELEQYTDQKESLYRKLYEPHIVAINGLIDFLEEVAKANIPMAVATSGLPINIQFMFDRVPIRKYFKTVVDSTHITHGKPHPEIYLKAAALLSVNASECIAFEDALAGIQSAKAAGMKVVALATSHTREEMQSADKVIDDYTQISLEQLEAL